MSIRKTVALAASALLVLGAAGLYGAASLVNYENRLHALRQPLAGAMAGLVSTVPRVVFRDTERGSGYGHVASVPLSDPKGARAVTAQACDRVYATNKYETCLRIDRGITTRFSATLYDAAGATVRTWPLPGVPSRTRISADSHLVAFTSFVTGSEYATAGFSTATDIAAVNGKDYGNIQKFALYIEGKRSASDDRNIWGVTFSANDNTFYATAALDDHTYLVRGDLAARTLTEVHETAECPSISPDGTRVAYKKNVGADGKTHWELAVLNLASNTETVLPEKRSVDDQVEWLNDSTLLYAVPGTTPGDSDIWSLPADGSGSPTLFIPHAFSPAVIQQ